MDSSNTPGSEGAFPPAPESGARTITSDMLAAPDSEVRPLGSETSASLPQQRSVDFEKGMRTVPPLAVVLIALNVAVFVAELVFGVLESPQAIVAAGALVRERVLAGEVWRLFAAPFLHGGFDHLFGNCVALYILGMACEHAYGIRQTGLIYAASGVAAGLFSVCLTQGPSVGASGAVFGLMGAAIAFFRRYGGLFTLRDNRLAGVLGFWALYSIATGVFQPYLDNAAHVGGLLSGAAVAWWLRPAILDRLTATERQRLGLEPAMPLTE